MAVPARRQDEQCQHRDRGRHGLSGRKLAVWSIASAQLVRHLDHAVSIVHGRPRTSCVAVVRPMLSPIRLRPPSEPPRLDANDSSKSGPISWPRSSPSVQATAAAHVILRKRNVRSAVGWVGLIWLAPVVGVSIYATMGVNRIQRKGADAAGRSAEVICEWISGTRGGTAPYATCVDGRSGPTWWTWPPSATACRVDRSSPGNRVHAPGGRGPEPIRSMLEAIAGATTSVSLASYIFDAGPVGDRFVEALAAAQQRGRRGACPGGRRRCALLQAADRASAETS
jgi:hypothetical protein